MIGLIAAMPQESDALLRLLLGWKRTGVGSFRAQSFDLSGQACLLVTSGMGARRAGQAARALLEMDARVLVSFGIAGAVEADLEIGDVVAVESVCRLDRGLPGPLLPLAAWPAAARQAAAQALAQRGARLFAGTAVTTGGSQVAAGQLGELTHPVLEMETAGIAQAAAQKGIPLLSLRAISDGPRAPIPFNLAEMMDDDANLQWVRMLKALARRPGIVLQFGRMLRNSRLAADNAALALLAALSELIMSR
jgi:adenosylhomocysteine nucleosidase